MAKQKQSDPDERLTTAQVCELLGMDRAHVKHHARTERLPGVKFGHVWSFRRGDVEAFVKLTPGPKVKPRKKRKPVVQA